MNLKLTGKRVFISASVSGIGFATAEAFLQEGAKVILNGRNEAHLRSAITSLRAKYGDNVCSYLGDMCSSDDVSELVDFIQTTFHGLDIFISNLGSGKPMSEQMETEEWLRFYDINVISSVRLVDVLYPLLKRSNAPSVVLISSVISREFASAPVGYASAKSAIRILNKYLSRAWAKDNIRVNCVLPGNIYFDGGRWEELLRQDKTGVTEYINTKVPMKRFGKPEEIADTILFLSSERASFITGAEISVDGGQLGAI